MLQADPLAAPAGSPAPAPAAAGTYTHTQAASKSLTGCTECPTNRCVQGAAARRRWHRPRIARMTARLLASATASSAPTASRKGGEPSACQPLAAAAATAALPQAEASAR